MLRDFEVHDSEEYDENEGGRGGRVAVHSVFLRFLSCKTTFNNLSLVLF